MRYFFGPLVIAGGVALIKYSFWITRQVGKIDFAEKYLAAPLNGTYTWWKLVGLFFMGLGVAWIFGLLDFGETIPSSAVTMLHYLLG